MSNKLTQLEFKRKEYINVKWKSSSTVRTRLVDVDDDYLLNIIRSVSKSLTVAEHFPQIQELQEYEGIKYSKWREYLQSEYSYREAIVEERYNQFIDQQIYEQSVRDMQYYDDRYDYPTEY